MKMTLIKLLLPATLVVRQAFAADTASAITDTCESSDNHAGGGDTTVTAEDYTKGTTATTMRCMCTDTAAASTDGDEIICEVGEFCYLFDHHSTEKVVAKPNCLDEPLCWNMDGIHKTEQKCTCMEDNSNIALICANDEYCLAENGELECKRDEYMSMAMGNPRTVPRTMHGNLNVMTCGFVEKHYYHGNYYVSDNERTACSDPKHWKFSESKTNVALKPASVEHGDAREFQAHFDKTCCKSLGPNALAGIIVASVVVFLAILIVLGCCRKSRATVEDEAEE